MRHNDLFHTDFFKNLKITGALCATLITCLALGGCHSLFGKDSDSDRLAENFTPELWDIYLKIREERGEEFQPENSFDDED